MSKKNEVETPVYLLDGTIVCFDCGKPFLIGWRIGDKSFVKNDNIQDIAVESTKYGENGEIIKNYRHFGCEGLTPFVRRKLEQRRDVKLGKRIGEIKMLVPHMKLKSFKRKRIKQFFFPEKFSAFKADCPECKSPHAIELVDAKGDDDSVICPKKGCVHHVPPNDAIWNKIEKQEIYG